MAESRIKNSGIFDPKAVQLLTRKCAKGQALGFADNQAFVGILSTMLIDEMFIINSQSGMVIPERYFSQ